MNSANILSIVTFVYGLAALLYSASWIFHKTNLGKLATWTTIIGLTGNTMGIIIRWIESYKLNIGHAPLSNMYESIIFFSWIIIVIFIFVEYKNNNNVFGAFVTPIAFLLMAYATLIPSAVSNKIQPLIPALKSNWLIAHVATCFVGYASFALAFCISLMFLIKNSKKNEQHRLLSNFPTSSVLDDLTHQMVIFGFLFLSIGIITGAVWANSAWGSYWSWDPKETWSLITWFIYATLLHTRSVHSWHGNRIAYLSIFGFVAVIFTYFGVNYLPGLHSYGQ